jgi:hypothetical protein
MDSSHGPVGVDSGAPKLEGTHAERAGVASILSLPRTRLIAVSTVVLIAVAALFGAWLIPAIAGAVAAALILIRRSQPRRSSRQTVSPRPPRGE